MTDASKVSISGVLMQPHDDKLFPVQYVSRKLLPAERNYHISETECLATIFTLQKLRYHLIGRQFTLHVDSTSLLHIQNPRKQTHPRLVRWGIILSEYNFKTERIPSNQNFADFLSRSSPEEEEKEEQI